jgi:hypothetical protein
MAQPAFQSPIYLQPIEHSVFPDLRSRLTNGELAAFDRA